MNRLEILEDEVINHGIDIQIADLPKTISGFYYNDENNKLIVLNKALKISAEQTCVLAEELGHYYTSCGNLLTDPSIDNTIIRKQEHIAKKWAVQKLVTLKNIIKAYEEGCNNLFEMAEYLGVTESFLVQAFKMYNSMYGKYKKRGKYTIYFDPPGIFKHID